MAAMTAPRVHVLPAGDQTRDRNHLRLTIPFLGEIEFGGIIKDSLKILGCAVASHSASEEEANTRLRTRLRCFFCLR